MPVPISKKLPYCRFRLICTKLIYMQLLQNYCINYRQYVFQKSLSPPLPDDLAVSFYLQGHKLVLAVYHLTSTTGTTKFDSVQAECSVPWLNPVLVSFTTALHIAHQLRDKVFKLPLTHSFALTVLKLKLLLN